VSRKKKTPEAVPAEILAEGSGPVAADVPPADAEPVVTAGAEGEGESEMIDAKPAKRRRGRRAEPETAPGDELADAEAISAAVAARADDVADDLAADASEVVEIEVRIEEISIEDGLALGDDAEDVVLAGTEDVVADDEAVADESTPRMSSISGRVIGWRYAMIARVSSCARDSRTGLPSISCCTHAENWVRVRNW